MTQSMREFGCRATMVAAVSALTVMVLPGREAQANATLAPDAAPTTGELNEIVVTAAPYTLLSADTSGTTNLPLPIEKVPQSISLVSNDFIKAADLKTLGEIAEFTPGAVNSGTQENWASAVKLRGFNVGEAIDGINVVGQGFYEPDYAIYDRLEITKGPSSVVYGVSSPGGLVNFVTKSATAQTPSYVSAQFGNWENYRFEGQIAGPLDPDQHVRAIGIIVEDIGNSFIDEVYHKKTALYGGLNFEYGPVSAYLHGGYERLSRPSFDGIPTEPDATPAPLPRSFFIGSRDIGMETKVYHSEAGLTWHVADADEFVLRANYERDHSSGSETYANSDIAPNGDLAIGAERFFGSGLTQSNYGVGGTNVYHLDSLGLKNSFISLSGLYQNSKYSIEQAYPADTPTVNVFSGEAAIAAALDALLVPAVLPYTYVANTSTKVYTFSEQTVLQVLDPVSVLLGASYSKQDTIASSGGPVQDFNFKGQVSYRAGLTYEFLQGANAYFSFSQSFTPQPLFNAGQVIVPPAIGEQYEGGVKYRTPGGALLLTGALFQIKEKAIAELAGQTPSGDSIYKTSTLTHRGGEVAALGHLTSQWQVNTGYTYLDPKVNADVNPLAIGHTELFLPKQTFSAFSTYTFANRGLKGLSLGAGFRYIGDEQTSFPGTVPPTQRFPSYTLVDVNGSYEIEKWLVQVNARNIFNRRYMINNYQLLIFGNQPGPPASVTLTVRRTF